MNRSYMQLIFRGLLLILAACVVNSCSNSRDERNATPNPLERLDEKLIEYQLTTVWSRRAVLGVKKEGFQSKLGMSEFQIFVVGTDGWLKVLDKKNGDVIQKEFLSLPDTQVSGGVSVGDGIVVLGTLSGKVLALDEKNISKRLWEKQVDSEVLCAPVVNSGVVLVKSIDGTITAFDAYRGNFLWKNKVSPPDLMFRGLGQPLVHEGMIFSGFSNGEIRSYKLSDGSLQWVISVTDPPNDSSELERMVDIIAKPILIGSEVFVSAYQGNTVSINKDTGMLVWRRPIPSYRTLVEGYGLVYIVDQESTVNGIKRSTGELSWSHDRLRLRQLSEPQIFRNSIIVGDYQGYVHCLSQINGEIVGRHKLASAAIKEQPIVEDNLLYMIDVQGWVYAMKIEKKA